MPVQWERSATSGNTASGNSATLELSANGAITTRVNLTDARQGVFPWIVAVADPVNIRWQLSGDPATEPAIPLHALTAEDRLIATANVENSLADDLFPSHRKIRVALDPLHLPQGPAAAWQTLDALLLPTADLEKIPLSMRRDLLAAGVTLAATTPSDFPPDQDLPWKRAATKTGQLWIISTDLPMPAIIEPQAYAPSIGWAGGKPWRARREAVLLAAIFCISAWGLSLWRGRWMPARVVLFCIAAMIVLAEILGAQSPVAQAQGVVHITGAGFALSDEWRFQRAHRDVELSLVFPHDGVAIPIFHDPAQLASAHPTLLCDPTGQPTRLAAELKSDWPMAVLTRRWEIPQNWPMVQPVTSPLRVLDVRSIYPGITVAGQMDDRAADPTDDTAWPAIVVRPISSK